MSLFCRRNYFGDNFDTIVSNITRFHPNKKRCFSKRHYFFNICFSYYFVSAAFSNWEEKMQRQKASLINLTSMNGNCSVFKQNFFAWRQKSRVFTEIFLVGRQNFPVFKENFLAGRRNFPAFKETSLIGARILSDDQRKLPCWEAQLPSIQRQLPF